MRAAIAAVASAENELKIALRQRKKISSEEKKKQKKNVKRRITQTSADHHTNTTYAEYLPM